MDNRGTKLKNLTRGKFSRLFAVVLPLIITLMITTAEAGQRLFAEHWIRDYNEVSWVMIVKAESRYDYNSTDEVFTIYDEVYIDSATAGDYQGAFMWYGVHAHMNDVPFPKIFAGYLHFDFPSGNLTMQKWQTNGPIQESPGVIFLEILLPDGRKLYPSMEASSWVMGPQTPVVADASLTAEMGLKEKVKFTSAVRKRDDTYKYTYTIKNETNDTVSVNVAAVNLDVELQKGEVYKHSIESERVGVELQEVLLVKSNHFGLANMRASVIVPIAETKEESTRQVAVAYKKEPKESDS